MRHFRKSVRDGALPFTCQGPESGLTIDGGETIGWEIMAQLGSARLDRVFVQVGGGALGSAVGRAFQHASRACERLRLPRIHAVQTRSAWPLARAYERLVRRLDAALGGSDAAPAELDQSSDALSFRQRRADRLAVAWSTDAMQCTLRRAAAQRADFMWPWETTPSSVAHGILDDETYDWLALTRAMIESGGYPVIVDEATLVRANELGHDATGIAADATGTAGLAGLMTLHAAHAIPAGETAVVLFTGARR